MITITVIAVGKIRERYFNDAINEYKKRLSRFARVNITEVPDEKIPENASEKECEGVLQREAAKILAKIPRGAHVTAMCVEGTELSSEELAAKIADVSMTSSHAVFIIGGSLGLAEAVKARADERVSFGKITLPHRLMRVVLLEQLYRAFKINANESYHK